MKFKNKKSGFTLLEIIIVIIIIGVLASLALPRLFATIQYSTATEALNFFGSIRRASDTCAMTQGQGDVAVGYPLCIDWPELNIDDPANQADAKFGYALAFAGTTLTVTATSIAVPADTIIYTYDTAAGATTRTGAGAFAAIN